MTYEQLLTLARRAGEKAYAPYSNFRVGAAVLLENGEVVCGNNQENISYGLSICAERVAVNFSRASFPDVAVKSIAIVGLDTDSLVSPCGACRQVLSEVAMSQGGDFEVVMSGGEKVIVRKVSELLPLVFSF